MIKKSLLTVLTSLVLAASIFILGCETDSDSGGSSESGGGESGATDTLQAVHLVEYTNLTGGANPDYRAKLLVVLAAKHDNGPDSAPTPLTWADFTVQIKKGNATNDYTEQVMERKPAVDGAAAYLGKYQSTLLYSAGNPVYTLIFNAQLTDGQEIVVKLGKSEAKTNYNAKASILSAFLNPYDSTYKNNDHGVFTAYDAFSPNEFKAMTVSVLNASNSSLEPVWNKERGVEAPQLYRATPSDVIVYYVQTAPKQFVKSWAVSSVGEQATVTINNPPAETEGYFVYNGFAGAVYDTKRPVLTLYDPPKTGRTSNDTVEMYMDVSETIIGGQGQGVFLAVDAEPEVTATTEGKYGDAISRKYIQNLGAADPDKAYTVYAVAVDAAGNKSDVVKFTTKKYLDGPAYLYIDAATGGAPFNPANRINARMIKDGFKMVVQPGTQGTKGYNVDLEITIVDKYDREDTFTVAFQPVAASTANPPTQTVEIPAGKAAALAEGTLGIAARYTSTEYESSTGSYYNPNDRVDTTVTTANAKGQPPVKDTTPPVPFGDQSRSEKFIKIVEKQGAGNKYAMSDTYSGAASVKEADEWALKHTLVENGNYPVPVYWSEDVWGTISANNFTLSGQKSDGNWSTTVGADYAAVVDSSTVTAMTVGTAHIAIATVLTSTSNGPKGYIGFNFYEGINNDAVAVLSYTAPAEQQASGWIDEAGNPVPSFTLPIYYIGLEPWTYGLKEAANTEGFIESKSTPGVPSENIRFYIYNTNVATGLESAAARAALTADERALLDILQNASSETAFIDVRKYLGDRVTSISRLDSGKFLYAVQYSNVDRGRIVAWGVKVIPETKPTTASQLVVNLKSIVVEVPAVPNDNGGWTYTPGMGDTTDTVDSPVTLGDGDVFEVGSSGVNITTDITFGAGSKVDATNGPINISTGGSITFSAGTQVEGASDNKPQITIGGHGEDNAWQWPNRITAGTITIKIEDGKEVFILTDVTLADNCHWGVDIGEEILRFVGTVIIPKDVSFYIEGPNPDGIDTSMGGSIDVTGVSGCYGGGTLYVKGGLNDEDRKKLRLTKNTAAENSWSFAGYTSSDEPADL